jgi:4'-phosphopantetheinyl transferase
MLQLAPGQIDLWLMFAEDVRDPHLVERYRQLMTAEERQQEGRFYFAKDRRRHAMTRALVRTTLSRYSCIAPQEWVFAENAYGKPRIANADALAQRLSFNVSHTDGLIVLGVTFDRALGVDTENVTAREACLDVADHFFARDEVAELFGLPPQLQSERFFQCWTLKESYIKARGMGLSIPLDQFSFAFVAADGILFSVEAALNDRASQWVFWHCRPSADHVVAICAERTPPDVEHVRAVRVVPLAAEIACPPCVVRQSS